MRLPRDKLAFMRRLRYVSAMSRTAALNSYYYSDEVRTS
jgi:hypothetical protein